MRLPTLLALLAFAASAPASATTYFYCSIRDYNDHVMYFHTPIMAAEVDEIDETKTAFAYGDEISPLIDRTIRGGYTARCSSSSNPVTIRKNFANLANGYEGTPQEVEFTHPPVPAKVVEASGAPLLVEKIGPKPEEAAKAAAQTAEVEAQRALARREEADRRAAEFARSTATDAAFAALLEAERERRRKCPSCQ